LADILFTFDMKKYFILSMLISFTMICSCQKQDSTVEQQLAQRKTELDTREDALIEREKALDERVNALDAKVNALNERVNALAENEQAAANAGMIPPAQSSDTISDPTQATAERDRKIQEIAAQFRAMVPDSGKAMLTKERLSEAQGALKELMSKKQAKWQTSGATGAPALQAISPTPSPAQQ
jgi:DNA repair exonuclease SbcCD ATPase subunit